MSECWQASEGLHLGSKASKDQQCNCVRVKAGSKTGTRNYFLSCYLSTPTSTCE